MVKRGTTEAERALEWARTELDDFDTSDPEVVAKLLARKEVYATALRAAMPQATPYLTLKAWYLLLLLDEPAALDEILAALGRDEQLRPWVETSLTHGFRKRAPSAEQLRRIEHVFLPRTYAAEVDRRAGAISVLVRLRSEALFARVDDLLVDPDAHIRMVIEQAVAERGEDRGLLDRVAAALATTADHFQLTLLGIYAKGGDRELARRAAMIAARTLEPGGALTEGKPLLVDMAIDTVVRGGGVDVAIPLLAAWLDAVGPERASQADSLRRRLAKLKAGPRN